MSGLNNKNKKAWIASTTGLSAIALGVAMFSTSGISQAFLGGGGISSPATKDYVAHSAEQGGSIASRITLTTMQTSVEGIQAARSGHELAKTNSALILAENQAHRIKEVVESLSIGKGVPYSLGCETRAEKTQEQAQRVMGKESTVRDTTAIASDYTRDGQTKQSEKTAVHLENFCDVTEASSGVCVPKPNGMGGKDSDYSNIHGNTLLSEEQKDAAYAFTQQVIDPAPFKVKGCDADICNSLTETNRAYRGLASMVHGAYISQINDASIHEYGKIGTDLNEKVDAGEGLDYLPNQG